MSLCHMGRTQLDPVRHPIRIELGLVDGGKTANANLDFHLLRPRTAMVRWRSEDKTVLVHCVEQCTDAGRRGGVPSRGSWGCRPRGASARGHPAPDGRVNPVFEEALTRACGGEVSRSALTKKGNGRTTCQLAGSPGQTRLTTSRFSELSHGCSFCR